MAIEKINFSYPVGSMQSVFEGEAKTALELSAITSRKVDECIELVNGVEQSAIEATAVVDEMRIAQEQFITENNDIRQQLVIENQEYLDSLTASKNEFDSTISTALTTAQSNMNTAFSEFQTNINNSKTSYETTMNTSLSEFETSLNSAKVEFINDMDSAVQNVINNSATNIQNDVNTKINALINDGTIGSLINDEIIGGVNASIVSNEIAFAESTGVGVVNGLSVLAQSNPNMSILVSSGVAHLYNGKRFELLSNQTINILPAHSSFTRKDIIYISSVGELSYTAGTAQNDPIAPSPSNALILAEIVVPATTTSIITANIIDKRVVKDDTVKLAISLKGLKNNNPVYVTDFEGVDPTGKSNCVTGIKNAIMYAIENEREVRFPDGIFLLNSGNFIGIDINGFTNLKISGTGKSIIRVPNGASESRSFVLRNGNGLEVSGLVFECMETTDRPTNGLDIMNCNDVHVHHCKFYNQTFYGLGIYEDTIDHVTGTCNNLIVENNYFYGVRTVGLEPFPKVLSTNQIIRNNVFESCGKTKIAGNGCAFKCAQGYKYAEIYNNTIIDCGNGTSSFASSIVSWGTCHFHNNKFTNCKRSAISITLGNHELFPSPENFDLLVTNNLMTANSDFDFYGYDPAISLSVSEVTTYNANIGSIKIAENSINKFYRGIAITPAYNLERIMLLDNKFTNVSEICVYADNSKGGQLVKPVISGNKFYSFKLTRAYVDIDLRNVDSPVIIDNTFINSGEYGIKLTNCNGTTTIDDNNFIGGNVTNIESRGAILITDALANTYFITNNNIIGGAWIALFGGSSAAPTFCVEGNVMPSLHRIATNTTPNITINELLGKHNTTSDVAIAGYIEVKDVNNTIRKVATIA